MNAGFSRGRPERVLIFGATSAIAAEVAVLHAARGDRLYLVGRTAEKLEVLKQRCRATTVMTRQAELGMPETARALVEEAIQALGGIDRVLIAYGELGDQLATEAEFESAEAILRINFVSAVALLIPLVNHLESQKSGRLGVITSVAGDRGRPRNYTYGAAKGALGLYLQGVRTRLYPSGVQVTTLKLGPVDTPMTREHTKHPLFGKPGPVAEALVAAMDRGEHEAYIPRFWALIMPVVRHMPEQLIQRLSFLSGR